MSGIKKRTVYWYRENDGTISFASLASVVTDIGQMVEPYNLQATDDGSEFDSASPLHRIDELREIDKDQLTRLLSGDDSGLVMHTNANPKLGK